MNHQYIKFEDVSDDVWDNWVKQISNASFLHSTSYLRFLHQMAPEGCARSFAILDSSGIPLALCPFAVSETDGKESTVLQAAWPGDPLAYPAIATCSPTARRRLARTIFDLLHAKAQQENIVRMVFRSYPINQGLMSQEDLPAPQMEALAYGYQCIPQNRLIMNLKLPLDILESNMTKYHRRRIHQTEKKGVTVEEYFGNASELSALFQSYRKAHFNYYGRQTRPESTFQLMFKTLIESKATLFVAFIQETPISFLYCGEFGKMAYGFSQTNVAKYEKEYSPRHLLEWQAIGRYQKRGFLYYDLGIRWFGPQLYKNPSEKEINISEFKERYGAHLWPDLMFEKFFDRGFFEFEMGRRFKQFLGSNYFAPSLGSEPS